MKISISQLCLWLVLAILPAQAIVYDGFDQVFDKEGELVEEIEYKNAKTTGAKRRFFSTGELEYEVKYDKKAKQWVFNSYYLDGSLESRIACETFEDGSGLKAYLNGMGVFYYKNGKLLQKILFRKGLPEGTGERFFENGKRMHLIPYVKGKITGIMKVYNVNGGLVKQIRFKNNIQTH